MNLLQKTQSYFRYLIHSQAPGTIQAVLPTTIFNKTTHNEPSMQEHFRRIEVLRSNMLKDHRVIEVKDFGAGGGADETEARTIASIVRKSSQLRRYNTLYYKLIQHQKPTKILELGTSFGFTTALMAMAAPNAQVITIEGCPATAALANENFDRLGISNIELIRGPFESQLDVVFRKYGKMDYIFFDGNHRMVPTLNYFLKALNHKHSGSLFVFDDIRWSEQMFDAWNELIKHPEITISLDLFSIGLVMFDPSIPEKHLQIRY
jgi:predicted O-methyltransferase YrrM